MLRTGFRNLIILLIAGSLILSCQQKTEIDITAVSSIVVDSVASEDGLTIYYDVRGEGDKTLVFVHGWSCDRSYWQDQVDEFAKTYRVVTVDLGGHGQSGLDREDWTIPTFGADVAAVVDNLQLDKVILIGHSMGGPTIIEAAHRLGDRVVALVGVDTYQDFEHTYAEQEIDGFLAPFQSDFVTTTDQFVRSMFLDSADSALVNRVAVDMSSAPTDVALSAIGNLLHWDDIAVLTKVRIPIRSVNSDRWPTNVEGNSNVAESFVVELMPGTGHFLHMEDPDSFNRLLHKTLEEFWPM
jgi:pimeloyl-ACP methyl ester carboxylesterase